MSPHLQFGFNACNLGFIQAIVCCKPHDLCWDVYYYKAGTARVGNARNRRAKEWQQPKIKVVAKIGVNRTEQNTEMKESITKDSLSTEI